MQVIVTVIVIALSTNAIVIVNVMTARIVRIAAIAKIAIAKITIVMTA